MYNQSAIGEMNFDELNQLMAKNANRIKQIEADFLEAKKLESLLQGCQEDGTRNFHDKGKVQG